MAFLPRNAPAVFLAVSLLFWGSAFPGIRRALAAYDPGHLAVVRLSVASLALALVALLSGIRRPRVRDLPGIALLGLSGFTVYHIALNYGEQTVTAGAASFLLSLAPILAILWAMLLTRERPAPQTWGGVAVCMVGAVLIAFSESGGVRFGAGTLLVMLAAFGGGLYVALQKFYLARYSAFELVAYAMWFGTLGTLPFAPGVVATVQAAPLRATLAVVYLGLFPAALAYLAWGYALKHFSVARATSFLYLIPGVAVVIGWIWLGELPRLLSLAGGGVALTGVIIVNNVRKKPET